MPGREGAILFGSGLIVLNLVATILLAMDRSSGWLDSPTVLQQRTIDSDADANATVQFGFRAFRAHDGWPDSVKYSSEQEEVFDETFFDAKKMADTAVIFRLIGLMNIFLVPIAPFVQLCAVCYCSERTASNFGVVLWVAFIANFPLSFCMSGAMSLLAVRHLSQSNLCGPSLIELQHTSSGERVGTIALIHDKVEASCEISDEVKDVITPIVFGVAVMSLDFILLFNAGCCFCCRCLMSFSRAISTRRPPRRQPRRQPGRTAPPAQRRNKVEQRENITDDESYIRSTEATMSSSSLSALEDDLDGCVELIVQANVAGASQTNEATDSWRMASSSNITTETTDIEEGTSERVGDIENTGDVRFICELASAPINDTTPHDEDKLLSDMDGKSTSDEEESGDDENEHFPDKHELKYHDGLDINGDDQEDPKSSQRQEKLGPSVGSMLGGDEGVSTKVAEELKAEENTEEAVSKNNENKMDVHGEEFAPIHGTTHHEGPMYAEDGTADDGLALVTSEGRLDRSSDHAMTEEDVEDKDLEIAASL